MQGTPARLGVGKKARPAPTEEERAGNAPAGAGGPGALDGVSAFLGLRWENPETVRLQIRPELINVGLKAEDARLMVTASVGYSI